MQKVATAEEMRNIDRMAIEDYGIPGIVLMENAGLAAASLMDQKFHDLHEKKVVVVCGKGNNGGDGFVVARHLFNDGVAVEVLLPGKRTQLKSDARTHADIAHKLGIPIHEINEKNFSAQHHLIRHCHIIVDAIFGTGLTKPVTGFNEKLIKKINASGKFVVSIDIPSGVDADSGGWIGPHIRADLTIALALMKRSHLLFPAAESMGEIQVTDISIPHAAVEKQNIPIHWMEENDVQELIPVRPSNTHKGDYGHILVLGGSKGKGGAAAMTALAALRSGAGLVTLAVPESCHQALEFNPLETMSLALPETKSGCLSTRALDTILGNLKGKTALAVGPGISTHRETIELLENLFPQIHCPLVIDADAINGLAKRPDLIDQIKAETVLTPHPKEMSRLTGHKTKDILDHRIERASEFAQAHNTVLLLKGARSLLAFPDGTLVINPTGNPGMATAGSGDVLTGIIAGLMGQGLTAPSATAAGAYLHGLAGDIYAEENSQATLIAGDLLDNLPEAFKRIQH